ncbi:hypothetical protein NDU88_004531 [Pleurodeles waltl]|uniref:Uncharacterized protein n=1 Tax=Pleurodeles waltl TaxID=8319 RepID=A0AAV7TUJ4_PLEWA|nr:hypothetical protein NDU88_004531 [Pleurodeles waltl]
MGPRSSPRGATPLLNAARRDAVSRRAVNFQQALPLAPEGSYHLHTTTRELRDETHSGVGRICCALLTRPGKRSCAPASKDAADSLTGAGINDSLSSHEIRSAVMKVQVRQIGRLHPVPLKGPAEAELGGHCVVDHRPRVDIINEGVP